MKYYQLLDFKIEPFSNSPDPRLFYQSRQHLEVLQKLEISIRLKRGLNVVIGDIGTGKTTVSRQLIQKISNDRAIEYYLILDPGFSTVHGFLTHILQLLEQKDPDNHLDENSLKERIKTHLFARGIDDDINTVLIIDEGQKLSLECLEVLRELLNFETNDQKLLQIVIFAQNEFDNSLGKVKNFQDRISFRYNLTTLNFKESKGLIQYRLSQSFVQGKQRPVFSAAAFTAIYAATKGSPRKIVMLCHQVILSMIIKNRKKANIFLIRSCINELFPSKKKGGMLFWTLLLLLLSIALSGGYYAGYFDRQAQAPETHIYPVSHEMPAGPADLPGTKPAASTPKSPSPIITDPVLSDPVLSHVYGRIMVPANTTVFQLISLVYGNFSQELLDQLTAYNTIISIPDKDLSGLSILFPAPEQEINYPDQTVFLLLHQTRDFRLAFKEAASGRYKNLDVRLLPFRRLDQGYVFNVVIDKPFEDKKQAFAFLQKTDPALTAVPKTIAFLKSDGLKDTGDE